RGLVRIEARVRTRRAHHHAVAGALPVGVGAVAIGAPLPDVAGHVVEAVPVGREGPDRRRALVAVGGQVLEGEAPLPEVRARLPAGGPVVAPGEALAVQ